MTQPGFAPTQLCAVRGEGGGCCSLGLYLSGRDYSVLVTGDWRLEAVSPSLVLIHRCDADPIRLEPSPSAS